MDNQIVTCYGVHSDDRGVKYLHQGRHQAMNFISLSQPSPFTVETGEGKKRAACPHLINGNTPMPDRVQWELFMEMYHDPLVKLFLPIPRHPTELVPYVSDPNNELQMYLLLLSRLSSPIYPLVHQLKNITTFRIQNELGLTNLCPLVITGVGTEDQAMIEQLAREARRAPRRLILTGDPMNVIRPPMMRVETFIQDFDELKLHTAPMENLGAVALRRYCRGEQVDSSWVRKEES